MIVQKEKKIIRLIQRYDVESNGCISCTFEGCKKDVKEGGYLQAGYTPRDEYGECPEEANKEIRFNLENGGIYEKNNQK